LELTEGAAGKGGSLVVGHLAEIWKLAEGDIRVADLKVLDNVRKDLNRYGRPLSIGNGGGFVKDPEILVARSWLFRDDGLHL
jgi:hypothetical protein